MTSFLNRFILPVFISLALFSSACSLKSKPATQTLTIQLPAEIRNAKNQSASRKIAGQNFLTPANLADFDCIGVNVVAPDINIRSAASSCTQPVKLNLSTAVAVVAKSAGSISIPVPAGNSRIIQLFGYSTSDNTCQTVDELMAGAPVTHEISLPYELARKTVNLTSDAEIAFTLQWNSGDTVAAFCATGPTSGEGCGFQSKYDCSKWDQATWQ